MDTTKSKVRCLIVDDEPLAIKLISSHIQQIETMEIVASCKNALQALEILRKEPVDLMFLDINMPGVDGTEILAYLRREPHLIPVPVFVVTSDDQPETRRKVMSLGATAMIIKPATIDMIESILRKTRIL